MARPDTNTPTSQEVKQACRDLMAGSVVVLGRWKDVADNQLVLQDFVRDGESFIPIFSDDEHFREETRGSQFEKMGLAIQCELFLAMLRGDEVLILNPGSTAPLRLRKADFF
jgi:hypothetical protein